MAIKHSTRRELGNLKRCAKSMLFNADLAVYWAQQEVVRPIDWVQNPLNSDQKCLFIIKKVELEKVRKKHAFQG